LVLGVVVVVGRPAGTLAPTSALESFLESGSHSASEIDALAKAEVESVLGEDAEAGAETEGPVPPPKKLGAAAPSPSSASSSSNDDIVRLVYDELKRMASSSSTNLPPAPGTPAATAMGNRDPRIQQLESRLTMFERKRTEEVNNQQNTQISSINKRLEGLDRTLAQLRKSAEQQQSLTSQLIRTQKANSDAKGYVNTQDYSVSYVKESIPADFEARVSDLLNGVKSEARKIYERYCPNCRKPNPPKVYPNEPTPAPAAVKKPMIPKNPFKKEPKMKKVVADDNGLSGAIDKMHAETLKEEAHDKKETLDNDIAADKPTAETHDEAPKADSPSPAAPAAPPQPKKDNAPPPMSEPPTPAKDDVAPKPVVNDDDVDKPRKTLFRPVIIGKEPTSEGLRLSKALNDISLALPVTPAYTLGKAEQALQDVLGADAVGKRFKTPRL